MQSQDNSSRLRRSKRAVFALEYPGRTVLGMDEVKPLPVTVGFLTPATSPPTFSALIYGLECSDEVLGVTRDGRMIVVTYCKAEDDADDFTWRTTCANHLDVTEDITGWMVLPTLVHEQAELSEESRIGLLNSVGMQIERLQDVQDALATALIGEDLSVLSVERLQYLADVLPRGFHRTEIKTYLASNHPDLG